MVSAWSNENNMVMGQVKTEEKSNEITAIPALGSIVTIYAMGCQKSIAGDIVKKEADYVLYVLAVKKEPIKRIIVQNKQGTQQKTLVV